MTMSKSERTEREATDAVTPRVLVRIDLEETPTRKPQTRFEAQTFKGSIHGGNNYDKTVVGFAEFSAYTSVYTDEEYADFRDQVESKAEYVHWKSEAEA